MVRYMDSCMDRWMNGWVGKCLQLRFCLEGTSPRVQAGHSTAPEKDAVDHFNTAVVEHCESTAWPLIHGDPPCHGPRPNFLEIMCAKYAELRATKRNNEVEAGVDWDYN